MKLITLMTLVTLTIHGRETSINTQGERETYLNGCTAVFIAPQYALTAGHCLADVVDDKLWAKDSDDKSYSAHIVYYDSKVDVGLIAINCPPHKYAELAETPVQRGDKVYNINSEQDMIGTYSEGYVANVLRVEELNNTLTTIHTAIIKHGASGSGLFNSKGQLVGINTVTMGELSGAVNEKPMLEFILKALMAASQ